MGGAFKSGFGTGVGGPLKWAQRNFQKSSKIDVFSSKIHVFLDFSLLRRFFFPTGPLKWAGPLKWTDCMSQKQPSGPLKWAATVED